MAIVMIKPHWKKAVRGVDWVFHLAGVTKAIKEETYFEVNGLGTENLIHACLDCNPRLQKIHLYFEPGSGRARSKWVQQKGVRPL